MKFLVRYETTYYWFDQIERDMVPETSMHTLEIEANTSAEAKSEAERLIGKDFYSQIGLGREYEANIVEVTPI